MEKRKLIKVGLVGFNEKMASSIAYFLNKPHAEISFQLTDCNDVEALILVNGDSIDGQVYLVDLKSANHKILIAQFKPPKDQRFQCLLKPIIPNELMKKLLVLSDSEFTPLKKESIHLYSHDKSHHLLKGALVADKEPQTQKNHVASIPLDDSNFYQPNRYLQGVLGRCLKEATDEHTVIQAYLPFGDVLVNAEDRQVYLMIGHKNIRVFERLPLAETVMFRPVENLAEKLKSTEHIHEVDFDDLIWNLGFAASCGRLPHGTDVDRTIQLKHWPNLTKAKNFKHACQIAALWSQNPLSIRQIIAKLNIEHKYVYGFYSAAKAAGLIEKSASNVLSIQSKKSPKPKPSIISRLLSHLRNVS